MNDCLVIGGGVIGLSLAYELAGRGRRVRVIDAGQPGREASWAGAGILPPAADQGEPLERLTALANRLHATWAAELLETTRVDNGFRRCGAVYLARDEAAAKQVAALARWAADRGIAAERVAAAQLGALEPALAAPSIRAACHLPEECQIRNPRHLKALLAGCQARGVEIVAGAAAEDFELREGRVLAALTSAGRMPAAQFCLTAGAWTAALARRLRAAVAVRPVRGQMVLLASDRPLLSRIVNEGSRYLVPRPDGRLLVGSTEEDVGYDRGTTAEATCDLLTLALELAPGLKHARLERSWAGLRPATRDGLPYLGRVPDLDNAFVAAGHFRSGLQLSTATAVVIGQLMAGEAPQVELAGFGLERHSDAAHDPARRPRPLPVH